MPGKLQLALQLLVGDARAAEIAVRLAHAPIGKSRRRERQGEQQARRDQELGLVAHHKSLSFCGEQQKLADLHLGASARFTGTGHVTAPTLYWVLTGN